MIEEFESLKEELTELAEILNKFKSEQVQLRIVDHLFEHGPRRNRTTENDAGGEQQKAQKSRKRRKAPQTNSSKKSGKSGRIGPATVLEQLKEEGYFSDHRTISDIIEYIANKKAKRFKPNELSGTLGRFVRDNRLEREQNGDGQYEYFTSQSSS